MNHPTPTDPGEPPLDPRLRELLASPSVWVDAPPELADRVVAAIAAERASDRATLRRDGEVSGEPVTAAPGRRAHRSRTASPVVMLAAASIVLVVTGIVAVAATTFVRSGGGAGGVAVALAAADPSRTATATAMVDTTPKGTKISLDASELPPAAPGTYYHAWLVSGDDRVSAGTFHLRGGDGQVQLWCGIDDPMYTTLAITLETADGSTPGGGEYVLVGTIGD